MPKILIVDDSESMPKLLGQFFAADRFDVSLAGNAQRAFEIIRSATPDVILLGLPLPDADGVELCKVFRGDPGTRHVPILLMAAVATPVEAKVKGFQAGADDYIVKPIDTAELLERVRVAMRRTAAAPLPAVSLDPPTAVAAAEDSATDRSLSMSEAALLALFRAKTLAELTALPSLIAPVLAAGGTLLAAGSLAAPGMSFRPLQVIAIALWLWFQSALVLSIAGSFAGLSLKWSDAANLISYASLPLLLKLFAAMLFSLATTLSPFLFTASPALFWEQAPFWVWRIDLLELWSLAVLWKLVASKKNHSRRGGLAVLSVWAAALLCLYALGRLTGA